MKPVPWLLLLSLLLSGCAGLFPMTDRLIVQVPSPNHDARRPNFVIIHDTANDAIERSLKTLTDPARQVSAHYLIARDGTLYQLVDESRRAWHAGESYWGGLADLNSASIGIELDNTGDEPYAEAQIARLLALLKDLQARYKIPAANVLGHGDVAPRRKVDPGRLFPWARLAGAGFGLWCSAQPDASDVPDVPDVPDVSDAPLPETRLALQAIGYAVADPDAALQAFRRHFLGTDETGPVSAAESRLMQCLAERKRDGHLPGR